MDARSDRWGATFANEAVSMSKVQTFVASGGERLAVSRGGMDALAPDEVAAARALRAPMEAIVEESEERS